jgi:hypothetical protein
MSTGDGPDAGGEARGDHADRGGGGRPERIGVGGGDDSVTRIQLAARWAESYPTDSDSLSGVLKRFRAAFEYLDAVTHGVEPPDLDREVAETRSPPQQVAPPSYAPSPQSEPQPPSPPPPAPQPEPRPWG